ncbi:SDR family NAD(P)-dependent oxidoreductase [Arthrobacter wenxiniae]|uniref:SDR family oxidoreductase n=1 Tax=Arthrobacter wenxiniae TaxID=2713570 RepID=A0A7Y7LZ60_9MICC|nr:SDR family oxidoreductase [Arthrobacter wenxiniae]NVM94301.1 SDR family oxidoreductase [Arthrobacter wenxiniae]
MTVDPITPFRPTAIVTGSSSGIGRACALELARTGWNLIVHGRTQGEDLTETVALSQAQGAHAVAVFADVRDSKAAQTLVDAAITNFGRIDGVINNAGTGLTKRFIDIVDDDWSSLFQMHLLAAARLLRLAHPHLVKTGGAAVNMSSLASNTAIPGRAGYGSVKAGLDGLTMQLAAEWAPDGVRVNSIAPGTILTPLVIRNFERGLLDENQVLQRTPLGRLGTPHEIATVARFLLTADSSYITGQTLRVDGGWSIWGGWS